MTAELLTLLRRVSIFSDLTEAELLEIYSCSTEESASPGKKLFLAGAEGDAMYAILDGQVRLFQVISDGSREILANLSDGAVLGEVSVIDGSPRSAMALVVSKSRLLRIDRQKFNQLRAQGRPAAFKVIRRISAIIAQRMRDTNLRLIRFIGDPEGSLEYLQSRRRTA